MQQSLNEEALQLLKEQVSKLKLLSNELELRDKQVEMLKDAIRSIEEERDELIRENQQMRLDLATLTEDVQKKYSRFETTISVLEGERRGLLEEDQQLRQALASAHRELKNTAKLAKELEIQREDLHRQLRTCKEQLKQYSTSNNSTLGELDSANRQIKQQKEMNDDLQAELNQLKDNATHSQQQLQLVKSKYDDIARTAEAQLRQLQAEKAKTKHLGLVERNLEEAKAEIGRLRNDAEKHQHAQHRKDRELLVLREELVELKSEHEKLTTNFDVDFKALMAGAMGLADEASGRTYRKSCQFFSRCASAFEDIERLLEEQHSKWNGKDQQTAALQLEVTRLKQEGETKQNLLLDLSRELEVLRLNCQNDIKQVEVEYELRLQELAVKLKREEVQLERLRNTDREFYGIQQELQRLKGDALQEAQTRKAQNQLLARQNAVLEEQLREMIPLCEQAIRTKHLCNHMKSVSCQLVRHVLFASHKLRQQALFVGMMKNFYFYYDRVHSAMRKKEPKKKRLGGIASFRAATTTIIVSLRLFKLSKATARGHSLDSNIGGSLSSGILGKDKGVKRLLRQSCSSEQSVVNSGDLELVNRLFATMDDTASAELLVLTLSQRISWVSRRYKSFNVTRTAQQDIKFIENCMLSMK